MAGPSKKSKQADQRDISQAEFDALPGMKRWAKSHVKKQDDYTASMMRRKFTRQLVQRLKYRAYVSKTSMLTILAKLSGYKTAKK